MTHPSAETQQFSEKTLKGFLLKNVEPGAQNPAIRELNNYLVRRVDQFWDQVIVPLRCNSRFDGNKINWYFEIYKEGIDAHKLRAHPFTYVNIKPQEIEALVALYDGKTLREYLDLGTSFLSNTYTFLTSYLRDQMVLLRLEHIYASENPYDWIIRAEEEEHGLMKQTPPMVEGLTDVINNIGLIMSRRV